jgi:hypothetical protein
MLMDDFGVRNGSKAASRKLMSNNFGRAPKSPSEEVLLECTH